MKTEKFSKKNSSKLNTLFFCALAALSFLAVIKTIFFSIDIDESYAVAQSYRLVQGDRLFADMWEPHQLSAYLSAFFIQCYLLLFGITDTIVVALRSIGCILHFAIGIYLFDTIKPYVSKWTGYLIFFLHLNFLPKWIALPEFELMQYWFFLLMAIWFARYYLGFPRKRYLILCGIFMVLQMLNYPTMVILYPLYLLAMRRCQPRGDSLKKEIALFTGAAFLTGVLFLLLLFSRMDLSEFISNSIRIFQDRSHNEGHTLARIAGYFGCFLLDCAAITLSYCLCLALCFFLYGRNRGKKWDEMLLPAVLMQLMVFAGIQIFGCLLADQNQFFLQTRYLLTAAASILLLIRKPKQETDFSVLFGRFILCPSFGAFGAALLLTNMSANVTYTKLFPCAFLCFILLDELIPDQKKLFLWLSMLTLLMGLLICKLVLIRVTGCLPVTVRAPFAKVSQGPLKHMYIHRNLASSYEADCTLLREYVSASDRLFYFGAENILYLCTEAEVSTASVQGTSVFDENFLDYFELHPEKYPTVIALDHNYTKGYDYTYSPYNAIVANWIEQEYPYERVIESDYMTLYLIRQ